MPWEMAHQLKYLPSWQENRCVEHQAQVKWQTQRLTYNHGLREQTRAYRKLAARPALALSSVLNWRILP